MLPPTPTPNTLFVKVERLRRLFLSREQVVTAKRGEDGTFGLSLSEDNVITSFNHRENSGDLRVGDQIRAVADSPLVREKLAALLERNFAGESSVPMHISRQWGDPPKYDDEECFAALQLRDARGEEIDEWASDLWSLRTDAVWGTFFTVPILPGTRTAWLAVHLSHVFTEPLLGGVELDVDRLPRDSLDTRWYSMRSEDSRRRESEIVGEVLLTLRKYYSSASVSYEQDLGESSDEEPSGPVDHATEPLRPIPEPTYVHHDQWREARMQ